MIYRDITLEQLERIMVQHLHGEVDFERKVAYNMFGVSTEIYFTELNIPALDKRIRIYMDDFDAKIYKTNFRGNDPGTKAYSKRECLAIALEHIRDEKLKEILE